ncbi:MAG TPA: spore germination protein [Bacillota bacterium]
MPPESLSHELQTLIGNPWDLTRRNLCLNGQRLEVLYLRGLVKEERIDQAVIRPLQDFLATIEGTSDQDLFSTDNFPPAFRTATETRILQNPKQATELLLEGWVLLVSNKAKFIPALYLPGWTKRPPSEPPGEKTLRGPREGFTEDLLENITLIRRWIKDPRLRVEEKTVGKRTKTKILLTFLADLASPELVREVHKRLDAIEIDAILESGYLEELITDERLTIFPLIQATERSDKVTAALLEGRVAILVDKSPSVLLVPVTINELYQSPEDYYLGYWLGSLLRIIRLIGNNLAILLPGLYVALVQVNPELLPSHLLLNIAGLRANFPFPIVVEVLFVAFAVEIFYESALRLPQSVASVGGVVSGIVLGYATVQAGIISSPTLVVIIVSTISLYSGPNYDVSIAWRVLKYLLILGSALLGVFGLAVTAALILAHAATLQSFGVSYLAPWAPLQPAALSDAPVRKPLWLKKRRLSTYRPQEMSRQGDTKQEDVSSRKGDEKD